MKEYCRAWVIGGDARYRYAAQALWNSGLPVKTWGVPGLPNDALYLENALEGANLVLMPMVPFREEKLTIAGETLEAAFLPKILGKDPVLMAGTFPETLEGWLQSQGVRCESLLEQETYRLKNAALTAEGAVNLAMEALDRSLYGAKALVIGWGRIGKFLAWKLKSLGAETTVAVRRSSQKTELQLLGYGAEDTGKYGLGLGDYDLILNTVPRPVLNLGQGEKTRKDCILIELASLPGGFPPELRDIRHVVMGQGLPGKYAPRTAGEDLKDAVWAGLRGGSME
jgi:dipicolinate synthase subunit A